MTGMLHSVPLCWAVSLRTLPRERLDEMLRSHAHFSTRGLLIICRFAIKQIIKIQNSKLEISRCYLGDNG